MALHKNCVHNESWTAFLGEWFTLCWRYENTRSGTSSFRNTALNIHANVWADVVDGLTFR